MYCENCGKEYENVLDKYGENCDKCGEKLSKAWKVEEKDFSCVKFIEKVEAQSINLAYQLSRLVSKQGLADY